MKTQEYLSLINNRPYNLGIAEASLLDRSFPYHYPLLTVDEYRPSLRRGAYGTEGNVYDRQISEGRINQALYDYERFELWNPELYPSRWLDSGEVAFLIHARDDHPEKWNDIARHFPNLSRKYFLQDEIRTRFRYIPPFRGARIYGMEDVSGKEIKGWVIVSTILPHEIEDFRSNRNFLRSNIIMAARLAQRLGAKILGLGAMTATLTNMGRLIEREVPGLKVTTGHTVTSFLIRDLVGDLVACTEQDLRKLTIAVVGARGSIGKTVARLLLPDTGKLILVDRVSMGGDLTDEVNQWRRESSHASVHCYVTTSNTDPQYQQLQEADIVVCATTTSEPFIQAQWLKPGTIFIDDSAPPAIAPGVAESRGGVTVHVVANRPNGFVDTFPYGLIEGSTFGCEAEVITLARHRRYDLAVTGSVDPENVPFFGHLAREAGFTLGPLQTYGTKIPDSIWNSIRREKRADWSRKNQVY